MGAVDGDHSAVQKYSTDTRVFLEYTQTVNKYRGCTQLYNRRFDCHAINNRTVPNSTIGLVVLKLKHRLYNRQNDNPRHGICIQQTAVLSLLK